MNLNQRLRNAVVNDLRRFLAELPNHYVGRTYSPEADEILANRVLDSFLQHGLSTQEHAAAEALNALAKFEIESRAAWSKVNTTQDTRTGHDTPDDITEPEERKIHDTERTVAGRFEVYRRAALVYARTINDALLIEAFQQHLATSAQSEDLNTEHAKVNAAPEATSMAWHANAWDIGVEILKKKPSLNMEQLAENVRIEMIKRKSEPAMSGRGGRVPTAESIKRHALTGIKS